MRLTVVFTNTLILFCLYQITFGFNLTLRTWNLNTFQPKKTIDKAITEYFESETSMMSVGIHLEYSKYWQIYIIEFLTNALQGSELMKFVIFSKNSNRVIRKKHVYYHNLWYVDSYKGFK